MKRSRLENEVAEFVVGGRGAHGFIEQATLAHDVALSKARDARGGVNQVWAETKKEIAFHKAQKLLLADVGPPASWVDKPARTREYVIPKRAPAPTKVVGHATTVTSENEVGLGKMDTDPELWRRSTNYIRATLMHRKQNLHGGGKRRVTSARPLLPPPKTRP